MRKKTNETKDLLVVLAFEVSVLVVSIISLIGKSKNRKENIMKCNMCCSDSLEDLYV